MKVLFRMIVFIMCVLTIIVCAGFAIYAEFASLPEGVAVSRWDVEWYWFFHFWYIWILCLVAVLGAGMTYPE